MSVASFKDYRKQATSGRPCEILFFSPMYLDAEGNPTGKCIGVTLRDGDVIGMLQVVEEDGGIIQEDEFGTHHFVPWPCAAVEIRDIEPEEQGR